MTEPGKDSRVPDMPPVPTDMGSEDHSDCWLWRHYDDTTHSYRNEDSLKPQPAPLTDVVTPENPLTADVYYSMRSPYSYLVLQRLVWLNSNYNVDVNLKVIFPVAVRTPAMFAGGSGGTEEGHAKGGRWYKWADCIHDTHRSGEYEGWPFRFADPDPVAQNHWPLGNPNSGAIAPLDQQPYIAWLTRLGNAAQLEGKSLDYVYNASPLIWGGRCEPGEWPGLIPEAFSKTGLNYDDTIKDIQQNPEKYDAVWQQNQKEFEASGHGGVPNMVFRGEPFFGQDRFNQFFWRLRQNGLTTRPEPRAPFTTKPLRWPDGI